MQNETLKREMAVYSEERDMLVQQMADHQQDAVEEMDSLKRSYEV